MAAEEKADRRGAWRRAGGHRAVVNVRESRSASSRTSRRAHRWTWGGGGGPRRPALYATLSGVPWRDAGWITVAAPSLASVPNRMGEDAIRGGDRRPQQHASVTTSQARSTVTRYLANQAGAAGVGRHDNGPPLAESVVARAMMTRFVERRSRGCRRVRRRRRHRGSIARHPPDGGTVPPMRYISRP